MKAGSEDVLEKLAARPDVVKSSSIASKLGGNHRKATMGSGMRNGSHDC